MIFHCLDANIAEKNGLQHLQHLIQERPKTKGLHTKKVFSESISIYKSYLKNTYLSPIIPSFIEVSPGPHPPASFRATLVSSSSLEVGDVPLISRCQTWGKPHEKWKFQWEKHGKYREIAIAEAP